ncbi:restriction endonuclease subunit S [Staphylococcus agnetis]|uniref:restriction endonuclease subunit S n=1 Tax=Staphylococcus agnetis TaxID=985762 RepID=UPI0021D0314E|nr:restriction endonuclease subunit S [Staphylococcus agnetis]UXU64436.1 restriction endonuclease subunit S [Staphylococcus agnetis]UXU66776.1 restriction endonuclease subunit S [Staphylococcus agnetis]
MTKTPQHNVPELRFPEFEGEWEEKKLGEISNRVKRKNSKLESTKPLTISGQLGLIDQVEYFSKSVSSKNLEGYTLLKKGEFAYNKSYSKGYPLGAIKQLTRYEQGVLSSLYICFDFGNIVLADFMKNYFESSKWHKEVSNIAVEGARNHGLLNIPVSDFFNIKLHITDDEEQEKIGTFFSKLDRQIELEEKKLELLEQQKKGYMQKIFSQELRFKDENGNEYPEWEEKKLGEEASITMGQSPKSQNYTSDEKNTVLIQGNADLNKGEIYPRIYTTQITKMAEVKDIILSIRAPVGEIAIAQIEACIGRGVCAIKGSKFIYIYLEYLKQINYWKKITQGSTFESISSNNIKNIIFYKPDKKEQAKIANFLSEIDKLIKDQSFKLEYLKQRKRGLLQKMFV